PPSEYSDEYGKSARAELETRNEPLPEQTRWVCKQLLAQIDFLVRQIRQLEQRLEDSVEVTPEIERLTPLPGIAEILAATIALESGGMGRLPGHLQLSHIG